MYMYTSPKGLKGYLNVPLQVADIETYTVLMVRSIALCCTQFLSPELAAPKLTDVHNMSADELSLLQHNFSALQAKFVRLMTEKAELLEKLQENEHLIEELSYETETIGESTVNCNLVGS